MPEFTLAQYKGLTFKKQEVKVEEKDIEEAIRRELLRSSRLVETKEPVKNDDFVNLDFDGYVDGKQFQGGKAENYQIQIEFHILNVILYYQIFHNIYLLYICL